eukprot:NODE_48_length_31852_cov_1.054168.p16 type:complete len:239 gc:universal NODE_48_length_31852_cov_1.054168:16987-16271(-)
MTTGFHVYYIYLAFFLEVMKPELYLNNPQAKTPLQKYIEIVDIKSTRSSNSEHTNSSTVVISPAPIQTQMLSHSEALVSPKMETLSPLISPEKSDKIDSASTRSRLSKHSSASSRLESGYVAESAYINSRKPSKDIVSEIFVKDRNLTKQKILISGESGIHEKIVGLYPLIHSDVVDIVIDYEKQIFGKDIIDIDEIPILEKRCKRKLDELTARKAKLLYTNNSQESLASQKSSSSRP